MPVRSTAGTTRLPGYNARSGSLVLRSGESRRWWMPFALFERTWRDSGYWAMVVVPPDRIPATADRKRYLEALVAFERAGNAKASVIAYRQHLARWPDELGASIGLANAFYSLGELDYVESVLRRALARHPDSVPVINNLAQTLSDKGANKEALEIIKRAPDAAGPHSDTVRETRLLIEERLWRR